MWELVKSCSRQPIKNTIQPYVTCYMLHVTNAWTSFSQSDFVRYLKEGEETRATSTINEGRVIEVIMAE